VSETLAQGGREVVGGHGAAGMLGDRASELISREFDETTTRQRQ
jgi:hypothetical protein